MESGVYTVGIDIGGTAIKAGLVGDDANVIRVARMPTPADDSDGLYAAVAELVRTLGEGVEVSAVGVAAAGFLDETRTVMRYAPNLVWRDEPLAARLEERLGIPVTLENDASAAGWAEYRFGVGRGASQMTMLTIGTGVGGAIVAGGVLLRGGFGIAAEPGHMRLVPNGLLCGCGARGCLEQYASGTALLRRANEVADAGGIGEGLARVRRERGSLGAEEIMELVRADDEGAALVAQELGEAIGTAAASIAALLDPEVFVIGGGVSVAGEYLLRPAREAFRAHLPAPNHRPIARFEIATLGNDAGVVGAAELARSVAHSR